MSHASPVTREPCLCTGVATSRHSPSSVLRATAVWPEAPLPVAKAPPTSATQCTEPRRANIRADCWPVPSSHSLAVSWREPLASVAQRVLAPEIRLVEEEHKIKDIVIAQLVRDHQAARAENKALREKVAPADGVLFATPEYNYSIPGVLKNAIDWLSRPTGQGPITGKPAAIIGASPSPFGTARAQAHLRQIVFYNAMPLLPYDEVLVMKAGNKIEDGRLVDEESRDFVKELMADFADWVRLHTERQAA